MMLLDLPPEIVENVIHQYVNKSGVPAAWKNRIVCRVFATYIRREILAMQPIEAFTKRKPNSGRLILDKTMEEYLFYRVHKLNGANALLPGFVNSMVDTLMVFPVDKCDFQQRERYTKVICKVLATTCPSAKPAITSSRSTVFKVEAACDVYANKMAVAAAVGRQDILKDLIVAKHYMLWAKSTAFVAPLVAAAVAGRTETVMDIMECYKQRRSNGQIGQFWGIEEIFYYAITYSIKSSNTEMVQILLPYTIKHFPYIPGRHIHAWIEDAVQTQDRKIVDSVLNIPVFRDPWERHCEWIENAFRIAHVLGFQEIMDILQARTFLDALCVQILTKTPLKMAVDSGHLHLVSYVLEKGGNPSEEPGVVDRAAKRLNLGMVQLLLEWGGDSEEVDLGLLRWESGNISKIVSRSERQKKIAGKIIELVQKARQARHTDESAQDPNTS